jgi:hypothetical protein
MSWPLVAAAIYLLIGVGLVALFVHQLPDDQRQLNRRDRWVLVSYVLLWPVIMFVVLSDVASNALGRFGR